MRSIHKWLMTASVFVVVYLVSTLLANVFKPEQPAPAVVVIANVTQLSTAEYVDKMMVVCKAKTTGLRRKIILEQVIRYADATFKDNRPLLEGWVYILCRENNFQPTNRSSAGAQGIGQLMPETANLMAARMGFDKSLTVDDLNDTDTNLRISSAYLKLLYDKIQNVGLSLAAYNAGPASKCVKAIKDRTQGCAETDSYVAGYAVFTEK